MGIYTRTGDEGQTSVIGGRVVKDDDRVEAYGTIDELNCFVGQAISLIDDAKGSFEDLKEQLSEIQQELFDCGSDLAFVNITENRYKVKDDKVARLEQWIDLFDAENPKVERFIIPGGTHLSSALHVCRTVCRRAERRAVTLGQHTDINPSVRRYLNRLSDYFFVVARTANARQQVQDVEYVRSKKVFRRKEAKSEE
ncbi:cob(I)yrinic acid a,c-diamide adenosyltransferase [Paenibacillus hubeiensis]|uniref:cob(I)yrinic acid a,c-diamide adenosyltransferase n=1 Tax=Paenibacillus hubeiensis TaxID=3077330 RepID=UPI0031BAA440